MSLTVATLLLGILLLVKGALLVWNKPAFQSWSIRALRDPALTLIMLAVASTWFLWEVLHLGESDFGNYRNLLFAFFLAVAVGSWFWVRDFLVVRATAVVWLLLSNLLLGAAFGQYDVPQRLFMVGFVYVSIAFMLYVAAAPYRVRDLAQWLFAKGGRARVLGAFLAGYGLLLLGVSATY